MTTPPPSARRRAALIRLLRCPEQLWLNIARNDSFDTFYIEGFSDEYLRRLQSLQAQQAASSHPR